MRKSKLVSSLNLSRKEFNKLTQGMKQDLKMSLSLVIFKGIPYEATDHSKQAIYHALKRLHFKKYGEQYDSRN